MSGRLLSFSLCRDRVWVPLLDERVGARKRRMKREEVVRRLRRIEE